jgi:hypothetical protein
MRRTRTRVDPPRVIGAVLNPGKVGASRVEVGHRCNTRVVSRIDPADADRDPGDLSIGEGEKKLISSRSAGEAPDRARGEGAAALYATSSDFWSRGLARRSGVRTGTYSTTM